MSTVKFKDIFWFAPKSKIKAGDGLDKGRFPFYTSSPILSKYYHTEQHFDEALIFGTGGSASVHFADEPFSTSTDCIVAIGKNENFNTKFVYYYLFGNLHILERGFKGAGLKHISKKYIQNIDIPVFDIETQNEIVSILDKANTLTLNISEFIKKINELEYSYFKEVFGDTYKNENNYPLIPLADLTKKIVDCPHSTPKYVDGITEYPCIRTSEISNGRITWESMKYLDEKGYEKRITRYKPVEGDIIFAREGTVGDSAIIPTGLNISLGQRVMLLSPNNELVNSEFLWSLLRSDGIQHKIKSKIIGATVKRINIGEFKKIQCPVPPLSLQEEYSLKLKHLFTLRSKKEIAQESSSQLLKSLVQRAFSGDLDLNVSVELDALIEEIDLQKPENDLYSILSNEEYINSLVDRLNNQDFENQDLYDKAKHAAFQLLKANEIIAQQYDEESKSLKLVVK